MNMYAKHIHSYNRLQSMQNTLQFIVGTIKKPKERFETILEPLQAVLQIGLLSFYPIGSKLAIHNNILTVQAPGYVQQVKRWYNNDKKEDVFYLYNVFSRFHKFYRQVLDDGGGSGGGGCGCGTDNRKLFLLLIELAKGGISNLIRTYNQTDKIHILHTLQMYKGMLDNPELVRRLSSTATTSIPPLMNERNDETYNNNNTDDDDQDLPRQYPLKIRSSGTASGSPPLRPLTTSGTGTGSGSGSGSGSFSIDNLVDNNIDAVFVKITVLYAQEDFTIIYNTLLKIQNDAQYYLNYVDGLNKILEPVNIRIKKWIDDNIVF